MRRRGATEVSKQSPSRPTRRAGDRPTPDRTRADLAYWRARVFRNTFTRRGRRFQVRGWSVKLQHEGRRRTIALGTPRRVVAARRAQALYRAITTLGWDAGLPRPGAVRKKASRSAVPAAAWTPRILRRPYTDHVRAPGEGSLAARIEHLGTRHCFPLGTDDPDEAARRARQIYETVVAEGWPAARARFPRELTVAVFWSANPVACTYTTLFSEPGTHLEIRTAEDPRRPRAPVAIVEPDAGTGRALARWIDRHARFRTEAGLATGREALRWAARGRPGVLLVSRDLRDRSGAAWLEALRARRPELPAFGYGVYEDSDQLFLSLTGVSGGYLLRRRPPEALLEPLAAGGVRPLTAREATQRVRRYFGRLLEAPPGEAEPLAFTHLTPREQEILGELGRGAPDKAIAERLGISVWTVRAHVKRIYEKLGVHTRTEAAVRYLEK